MGKDETDLKEELEEIVAESIEDDDLVEEVEEVTTEDLLQEKDEIIKELQDKFLRLQAETDNFRKRILRDKEDAIKYANVNLIKDLIGPLDDFDRAIEVSKKTEDIASFREGVEMIDNQINTMLKNNWGLVIIDKENVPFNAEEHEACMLEINEDLKEETVLAIFQKGYKIGQRVIRPAKVKVGKPN